MNEIETLQNRIKTLEAENERLVLRIMKLTNDKASYRSQLEELRSENERMKGELKQSATNCHKMKCLALHAMSELFYYKREYLEALPVSIDYAIEKYFDLWAKFSEAYHKTKKELMEGNDHGTV